MTSIVIPAHNEGRVLGRTLDAVLGSAPDGPSTDGFDVLVVCNGCTDDTAETARRRGVRVLELPEPSKHAALRAGDELAHGFPRVYLDADVVISGADLRTLTGALGDGVLAAAPGRDLPLDDCDWRVRAYYRVWQRLPAVRAGLFGRGVIAVSEEGQRRLAALPPLMADDLAASLAFGPDERKVVELARVTVHPPRTWPDLIRRRVRADTSSTQLERHQRQAAADGAQPAAHPTARTSKADLLALMRAEPALMASVPVFAAAAVIARRRSREAVRVGDFGTWLRDESSRQA
ncbi:glycosyltransferase [Streptacidiphilus sp. EB129]|uniref:glycosyltransferase n=1 Tax=Streptacidiphilus sp. EB129 TaxID=3156262 RepID=UPI003518533E